MGGFPSIVENSRAKYSKVSIYRMASVSTLSFFKFRLYAKSTLFNEKFNFGHMILYLKSRLYFKSRFVKSRLYCAYRVSIKVVVGNNKAKLLERDSHHNEPENGGCYRFFRFIALSGFHSVSVLYIMENVKERSNKSPAMDTIS